MTCQKILFLPAPLADESKPNSDNYLLQAGQPSNHIHKGQVQGNDDAFHINSG